MSHPTSEPVWLNETSYSISDFTRHVESQRGKINYSLAADLQDGIPIYDGSELRDVFDEVETAQPYMSEMNRTFLSGSGVVAVRNGVADIGLLDDVTGTLNQIIEEEESQQSGKGDHFATAGANSRIWNSHEKLCMKSPRLFAAYNANNVVRRISESWLGTGYQITMQANVVRPGGRAQTAHRDYHMGFQSVSELANYPASQHVLSAHLTLQGAIAHTEMPIESGPTKLLPYSQSYVPGYMAIHTDEFREYFESNYVQLPLEKGDMLFFNPATFHAAGDNNTDSIHRFANLMQVGSAYGRSIEIVDRLRMSKTLYPDLLSMKTSGHLTEFDLDTVVAATAEGYPFPANLDIDSPLTGMAPPSQQDVMRQALNEGWAAARFNEELDAQIGRKRSH